VAGQVSHCFPLNGDAANPEVDGVEGILSAYENTMKRSDVVLSGPTCFTPMLNYACNRPTSQARDGRSYLCILILTDGEITDMASTVDAIVAASSSPVSIIIVGVGDGCDFQAMDRLDGDGLAMRNKAGKVAERDIVQFVPFRNYVGADPAKLAQDTLHELPGQLLGFMNKHGIMPSKAVVPPPPPPGIQAPTGAGADAGAGAEQSRAPPPAYADQ
jgi:hypothetical protein